MSGDRASVLVIGAGSIGARHAANLRAAGAHVTVTDPDEDRARAAAADATVAFDLDALPAVDGIVVASPTRFHLDHARRAVATGAAVLVEKPLAEHAEGVDELVATAGPRLMVGYNLRLHAPIERLVALVGQGRVGTPVALRLWFGSWLPDWRPGVDYRTTYSARGELGGGVLNDAIHELDLAVWLAGADLDVVGALVARLGPLEIDVEDTVRALLRTPDGVPVEIALDYLSRTYRRGIEVIGDEGTMRLDWARAMLETETPDGVETEAADTPVSVSYEREAEAFLAVVRGEAAPPVDGHTGLASLRLADAIRAAGQHLAVTTLCVVQARMGSTRLPGKVLAELGGRPMLALMLGRLGPLLGPVVDDIVVATSDLTQDDPVAEAARAAGTPAVRGSERDVLSRFLAALDTHPADTVVRLTADCPLMDPALVTAVVERHRRAGAAYTSNTLVRTFPDGLDVEVVAADALRAAAADAVDPAEREHVTPFVYRRPLRFGLAALRNAEPLGDERWTVDTAADLDHLRAVVARLDDPLTAGWHQILAVTGVTERPAGTPWLRPLYAADLTALAQAGAAVPVADPATLDAPATRWWALERDGELLGWVAVAVEDGIGTLSGRVRPEDRATARTLLGQALGADLQVTALAGDL